MNNVLRVKDFLLLRIVSNLLFTDVVAAYKDLKKEKDVLESTVRALSSTTTSSTASGESIVERNETDLNAVEVVKFLHLEKC